MWYLGLLLKSSGMEPQNKIKKGWEGCKSRGWLYLKCMQAMHHCLLSALANAPALFNLVPLSSRSAPRSQRSEGCNTLQLATGTPQANCVKTTCPCGEQNLPRMCRRKLTVEYLVFHLPLGASSVQCSVNIIHFVTSEQKWEALASSSPGSRVCSLRAAWALWGSVLTREGLEITRQEQNPIIFTWKETTCYRALKLWQNSRKAHDLFTMCLKASELYKRHLLWITMLSQGIVLLITWRMY